MADLSVIYAGMKLKNPIIGGSGPTYDTVAGCQAAVEAGFAGFILKSVAPAGLGPAGYQHAVPRFKTVSRFHPYRRWQPELGEENMDIHTVGEVGSVWGEDGYADFAHRVRQAVGHRAKIGISTFGIEFGIPRDSTAEKVYDKHFEILAQILANGDGDFIELPIANNGFKELDIPRLITKAKKMFSVPVTVKCSDPLYFNVIDRARMLQDAGVDGITLFDATTALDFDIETMKVPFRYSWHHYMGGTTIPWVVACIARCRIAGITVPITGSFGVWEWPHVIKLIMAGADIIQVCRKVMVRGHSAVAKWLPEINDYLDRHGFKGITDIKGKLLETLDYRYKKLTREMPLERGGVPSLKAVVDLNKCEGCTHWCIPSCGYFAMRQAGNKVEIIESRCAVCGACEGTCPVEAISFQSRTPEEIEEFKRKYL